MRSVERAGVDVFDKLQVILGSAAGRKDGRVAGFEQRLHLLLIEPIDVLVRIDVARHRGHAFGIDHPKTSGIGRAGGSGNDLAAADDDRAGLDDRTRNSNDAGVGDGRILRGEVKAEACRHAQADDER